MRQRVEKCLKILSRVTLFDFLIFDLKMANLQGVKKRGLFSNCNNSCIKCRNLLIFVWLIFLSSDDVSLPGGASTGSGVVVTS